MITCRQIKKLALTLFILGTFISFFIDFLSLEPTYGVTIFNLIKLFIFEIIVIIFYCRKIAS